MIALSKAVKDGQPGRPARALLRVVACTYLCWQQRVWLARLACIHILTCTHTFLYQIPPRLQQAARLRHMSAVRAPQLLLAVLASVTALACRAQRLTTGTCFAVRFSTPRPAFDYTISVTSFAGCNPALIKCASASGKLPDQCTRALGHRLNIPGQRQIRFGLLACVVHSDVPNHPELEASDCRSSTSVAFATRLKRNLLVGLCPDLPRPAALPASHCATICWAHPITAALSAISPGTSQR